MTRCPFALTTTCLLAALAMVVYSAGQDVNVNKQVRWFLDHHVKSQQVRKLIEWATIHGGAYYSVVVFAAHIVGYLIAVNWFQVSHALAGQALLIVAVGGSIMALTGYLIMMRKQSSHPPVSSSFPRSTTTISPHDEIGRQSFQQQDTTLQK